MNEERIQELMNEAGLCGYGERYGEYIIPVPAYKNRMNRFAELIVAEVITVLQKRFMGDLNREDMEVRRCITDVKKHFGVEE